MVGNFYPDGGLIDDDCRDCLEVCAGAKRPLFSRRSRGSSAADFDDCVNYAATGLPNRAFSG